MYTSYVSIEPNRSASVGSSQCSTGVRSVTIVVLPGESKSKSLGRSFSAFTTKDCNGVV